MFLFHKLSNPHHKSAEEQEALRIAKYHALMKAKLVGNILIIMYTIITILLSIESYTPLYILIAHNLFPLLLQQFLSSIREEKPLLLPLFAKYYKYSASKYQSNAMSFLCTCFFLFLWQQSELKNTANLASNNIFQVLSPTLILFVIVVCRIAGLFYYSKKFDHILTYGSNIKR